MPELIVNRPVIIVCTVLTLMLTACAGPWNTAPNRLSGPQWSITPPEEWMHLSTQESEMLSKDGPYLEYILIQSRPMVQEFRHTKQKLNPGMLPYEAARLITDNMLSDPLIRQFRLLASEPAMVGGHDGFRLTYTYQDPSGVEIKTIYYGVILPDRFFNLRYTATQRYYFDKELPAFNKVLESLRLVLN
ncbi:hypothetical protein [uncultured Desulfosarcina sp.]|uniref:hypothetical protein n=1 Tax=uncultured Desulfosarcina sp. TaxID=218289 RepID=UPI0029C8B3E9|nr:hypothetical protein [uncultured Desulfosarcina sp.]